MAGDTEEKSLPASQRKLRKAREKGQVANSSDFVAAVTFAAGLVMVGLSWPRYVEIYSTALRVSLSPEHRRGADGAMQALLDLGTLLAQTLAPMLAIVAGAGFLAHVAHKKGLVFSIDPIVPDFNRVNPGEGFKRIFSARHAWELLIALARCLSWFVVAGVIVWLALPGLLASPLCEAACVTTASADLLRRLAITAIFFLIVLGLLDLPFQTLMFLKEQRMSRSEMKRERKEMEGAPEFVGYRRDQHRQMASGGGGGLRSASVVVISSGEAVAIAYDPVKQPVPMIVAKGVGPHADPIIASAQAMGIPIDIEPRLAQELARFGAGTLVPEREFNAVAMALVRHGKI